MKWKTIWYKTNYKAKNKVVENKKTLDCRLKKIIIIHKIFFLNL